MSRRRGVVVLALFLAVWSIPAVAGAAPPDNDEFEGSIVIGDLPYHAEQDTSEATTSEADLEAAVLCEGPPAYDAAVWYTHTATADEGIEIVAEGSDYSVGFLVYTGGPGAWELVTCGGFGTAFTASAGETYHILVIDDQLDEGGNGGKLSMHVSSLGAELCPGIYEGDPIFETGNVIMGTEGDDELNGTPRRDIIIGLGGNDIIHGRGGHDAIAGCDGDDHITGGPGRDEILGDAFGFFGNPEAEGGNDFVNGNGFADFIFGGAGDDTLLGGFGPDFVVGHQGDDIIKGYRGHDELLGGFGDDDVQGHRGNDFLSGGWGNDFLKGGSGDDFLGGAPPAFPPDAPDPEPDAIDECLGGPGEDGAIHCEIVRSASGPAFAIAHDSMWGTSVWGMSRYTTD